MKKLSVTSYFFLFGLICFVLLLPLPTQAMPIKELLGFSGITVWEQTTTTREHTFNADDLLLQEDSNNRQDGTVDFFGVNGGVIDGMFIYEEYDVYISDQEGNLDYENGECITILINYNYPGGLAGNINAVRLDGIGGEGIYASEVASFAMGANCIESDNQNALGNDLATWTHLGDGENMRLTLSFNPGVDLVNNLVENVIGLNINKGMANSLDAKLSTALKVLDDMNEKNDGAAINNLQAFINAVEAQRGKKIPEDKADELIAAALDIIVLLSN